MRDQEIIGLWEAYQQVHSQPEEVEVVDEGRNTSLQALAREKHNKENPKGKFDTDKSLMMGHNSPSAYKYTKDPETGSWSNEGRRDGRTEPELRRIVSQRALRNRRGVDAVPRRNGRPMFESAEDLFDYLLEYLVAEGYADTNKAALVIMANMSEEWKQSIVEDIRGAITYNPNTPIGKLKRRIKGSTPEKREARTRAYQGNRSDAAERYGASQRNPYDDNRGDIPSLRGK